MARLLLIFSGTIAVGIGAVWLTWYLAFGLPSGLPARVAAPGLEANVEVGWTSEGTAYISAGSLEDGVAGLGFAQTWRHAWHLSLLRRTATGRLSEWFGEATANLDELALWLNLPGGAREAYEALPDAEKQLLDSFAAGVNAALARRAVNQTDEFVLLGVTPERWQPWHTIAVERLIAWLSTPEELVGDDAGVDYHARALLQRRKALKDWLHLHGFESSAVILHTATGEEVLGLSQVYGATALSLFQDAELNLPGSTIRGVSLIGTPYFVLGTAGDLQWAWVLSSPATLAPLARGTTLPQPRYARIRLDDGREKITVVRRAGDALLLAEPVYTAPPPDAPPPRRLRWTGLAPGSDAAAWLGLLRGNPDVDFHLMDGLGVILNGPEHRISGPGDRRTRYNAGTILSPSGQIRASLAERLAELSAADADDTGFADVMDDVRSRWAAWKAPAMIAAIDTLSRIPPKVSEALMYLRNWDFRFDEASIGAAIFDVWHRHYEEAGGRPAPERTYLRAGDPPQTEVVRAGESLLSALDWLESRHGTDRGLWRWEEVQPNKRFYPAFSDTLLGLDASRRLVETRYAPVRGAAGGHPSTARYGPASASEEATAAPAVYRAWINGREDPRLVVYADDFHHRGFLGRYLLESGPVMRTVSAGGEITARTVLTPR